MWLHWSPLGIPGTNSTSQVQPFGIDMTRSLFAPPASMLHEEEEEVLA